MIVKDTDIAWLAGVFDGEGCVGFKGNKARKAPQVYWQIDNTDEILLERVHKILMALEVHHHFHKKGKGAKHHKRAWRVQTNGSQHVLKILMCMLPHLTAKRKQAELVCEYLEWRLNDIPLHSPAKWVSDEIEKRRSDVIHQLGALKKDEHTFSFLRTPDEANIH